MSTQEQSATEDELRILRARAYGPAADIHDDPEALRRLSELEAQARPDPPSSVTGVPVEPARGTGAGAVDSTAEPDAPPDEAGPVRIRPQGERDSDQAADAAPDAAGATVDETAAPPADAHPERPAAPWWRRPRTLWVASVVLAAITASAVTMAMSQAAAGRVAVLNVDRESEWPDDFFTPDGGGLVFEEFHGMRAFIAPQEWNEGEELDCLYVRAVNSGGGSSTGGCAGGTFPPTAGLVVAPTSPAELRERFADGTSLQFVAQGAQVYVYADEP